MDFRRIHSAVGEALEDFYERYLTALGWMLWGKPSSPAAPDYAAAAKAQGTQNLQTTVANQVMGQVAQNTPYGSLTYDQTGTYDVPSGTRHWDNAAQQWKEDPGTKIPTYTSNIHLSPEVQQLVGADLQQRLGSTNLANDALGRVSSSLAQPFDVSSDEARRRVEDALYSRSTRYLDPQWNQAEEAERTRLANQGFSVSTNDNQNVGYSDAMRNFNDAKTRAYANARDTAVGAGLQEQQQAIQELLLQRMQPLTEYNALRTGATPQLPQFTGTAPGNAAPAPVFGAAQAQAGANNDIYNADVGAYNSNMQGLYGLGAAGLGAYAAVAL